MGNTEEWEYKIKLSKVNVKRKRGQETITQEEENVMGMNIEKGEIEGKKRDKGK